MQCISWLIQWLQPFHLVHMQSIASVSLDVSVCSSLYTFLDFHIHAENQRDSLLFVCAYKFIFIESCLSYAFYSISYLAVILPFLLIVVIIWLIYGIVMDSIAKARSQQLNALTISCSYLFEAFIIYTLCVCTFSLFVRPNVL